MKTTSIRARAMACALLTTTATLALAAAPAAAQSSIPSSRPAPDANGVDVISGELNAQVRSVSIGRPGESGLTYSSSYSDGLPQDSFVLEMSGGTLNIQGRTVSFSMVSGSWVPDDGDGSTLIPFGNDWVYTARDGTRVEFLTDYGDYALGINGLITARGTRIIQPDGEQLDYFYRTEAPPPCPTSDPCITPDGSGAIRVQSVTSNFGYQLKAYYATNGFNAELPDPDFNALTRVVAINRAVDYCAPTADTCPTFTQAWPELNLGGSAATTRTLTDNLSNTVTVTSSNGAPASITSPADPAADLTITHDSSGRVATIGRGGGSWGYSYSDSAGQRTTTVTQPLGGSRTYVSDLNLKRLLSFTDELGRTTSHQYDSRGRRTRTTFPEGNYVQLTFDARGNVTETRRVAKPGSGLADIVSTASFPATCSNVKSCNKPTSTTNERGFVTDYTYDSGHGGLLTVTAPAPTGGAVRPQTRFSYAPLNAYIKSSNGSIQSVAIPVTRLTAVSTCQTQSSCAGTADEVKSTIAYGSIGVANNLLPTAISSGDGSGALIATTTNAYDVFGNVTSVDGPLAGTADTSGMRYDAARRLTMRVSPDPDGGGPLKHRAQKLTYNGDGNVMKVEAGTTTTLTGTFTPLPSGERAEYAFDTLGRRMKQSLVSGTSTTHAVAQMNYDIKGRPLCTVQRMNPAEFASLPADACALDIAGTFGPDRVAKTIYNNADEVTQLQAAVGTADQANDRSLTYSNNGRLATLTDAEVNRTTYEYDGHDRLSKTRMPLPTKGANASSTTDYEQLTYDAASNVTARRLRDAQSVAYTYNNLDRPTLKNLPGTEPDATYAYDNLGRLISASQTGHALSFTYDALNRNLTQVSPQGTVASQWDVAGRRTKLTYPGSGLFIDYDYLVTDEMTKVRENGATTGVGVLATYGYDDSGGRTGVTFGNGAAQVFAYDPVSRLASLNNNLTGTTNDLTATFAYNPASQIASTVRTGDAYAWNSHFNENKTGTANGLNQLTQVGAKTVTHDTRGNVTAFGTKAFTYSSENLLATGPNATTLSYDPLMRLHQTVSGGSTNRFAYDGLDRIAEFDAANGLLRRYAHGPGDDEPIVWYEGSGTAVRRFLGADERGSIVSVTDSAGALLGLNRYDEYGQPQATNLGAFGYTGQTWLPTVGAYYYKARIYDGESGRFLQPDPIGYDDGPNLYAYVGNDAVNHVDPLGSETIVVTGRRVPKADDGGSSAKSIFTAFNLLPGMLAPSIDSATIDISGEANACVTAAAAIPPNAAARGVTGTTYGDNPSFRNVMNSNIPGSDSLAHAFWEFVAVTTLVGDLGGINVNPAPGVLIRSLPSGIQLRQKSGPDNRYRIDIPPGRGPGGLSVQESVKIGDQQKKNQCPVR